MPKIWTDKPEVHAAFIAREIEQQSARLQSLSNAELTEDVRNALENNRLITAGYFGLTVLDLSMARQVHGNKVLYTRIPGMAGDADGLVTDRPGLAVGVLVADCAALLFADPVNKIVAAVHAGWRGATSGIISEAVREMEKIGAEPDLIHAYVSPCISLEKFEVGEEVASRFPEKHVDRSRAKPHVDLHGFIFHEILKTGIPESHIIRDASCTFRHEKRLHSHRRDGLHSGRMLGVICLAE
jgi:polyphenol oxidase